MANWFDFCGILQITLTTLHVHPLKQKRNGFCVCDVRDAKKLCNCAMLNVNDSGSHEKDRHMCVVCYLNVIAIGF